jgi:hypothetical protein
LPILPDRWILMADYSGRGVLNWWGEELPKESPLTGPGGTFMESDFHSRTMLVDENGRIIDELPDSK